MEYGYKPTKTSGIFTGLWIVSIRTCWRWHTGSDSAILRGSLGWVTLTYVEASICGNVLRELGSKGNPLSHSPKVSGNVPSAKYFRTLDLFLQLCVSGAQ